jgi:hypothetical protein
MEEEIDKTTFISTAWPMMKPFIMKQQELSKPAEVDEGAQQEEAVPDVMSTFLSKSL